MCPSHRLERKKTITADRFVACYDIEEKPLFMRTELRNIMQLRMRKGPLLMRTEPRGVLPISGQ
jgi:hypothetical protein